MPSSTASARVTLLERINATVEHYNKAESSLGDDHPSLYTEMDTTAIVVGVGDRFEIDWKNPWPETIEIITEDTPSGDNNRKKLSLDVTATSLLWPKDGAPLSGPPTPTHSECFLPVEEYASFEARRRLEERHRGDLGGSCEASPARSRDTSPSLSEDHGDIPSGHHKRRALTEISIQPTVAYSMAITEDEEPRSARDEGPRSPFPWSTFHPNRPRCVGSQMAK